MPYKDYEQHKTRTRERRAKNRSDYLKDKSCVRCGSNENLNMHHIDPNTKITNVFWGWSKERRLKEIAKCEVLCVDCHKAEHAPKHGTPSMYSAYGCRCKACKKAGSEYRAKLKREKEVSPV